MKKFLFLSGALLVLLTACSTSDSFKEDKDKSHAEQKDTQSKKSDAKTTTINTAKLSEKAKLALAFCVEDAEQYTLTKNEILTGIYEYRLSTGKKILKLVDFTLVKVKDPINNAPEDMHFYTVYPDKGNFKALIGVNKDKIFIGRMKKDVEDYNELLAKGEEVDLKDVYLKNKGNKALPELISKMNISNTPPKDEEDNGNPLSDKNLEKSGVVNTHFRTQAYQLISDFEDIPVSKTNYIWDDVKPIGNKGDWKVNYRNKDGEILGTYVMKKGKISKLDPNGKVIKQEK
ncbi:hypothetical protein CD127_01205 [Staphylococcus petrasii]|uniref:hypothetical protein n=1 Tax=Staphylococcus petrasii TaxID=1276936 RepID=UPI000CD1E498|nr:hypothetical protein [Staphylococcus petrasii]PNZ84796.1 hypothetical protein CD127_01205 [Staphylococcus petrasii]TGA81322.1 hypothetical protein E2554_07335 [Staphylococcus petrasii]SUM58785.1 lipoprotein [Staphylococcus petrasii]